MFAKRRRSLRPKKKENPRRVLIRQIFIGLFLAVFFYGLGYGVWHGSRLDALTIQEVQVTGGETISHTTVRELVEEKLEGTYFRLVPRRFAWTFPAQEIQVAVGELSRVHNVEVDRIDGQTITVSFSEFHPHALWCQSLDVNDCVFIDETGYAFDKAPNLTGNAFVRYLDPAKEVVVGTQAFSPEYISGSRQLIEYLGDNFGFVVEAVLKTAEDESEYYLIGGGFLKISKRQTITYTLENLEAILSSEEFSDLKPGNFQYIDLRYGNKIFVNEEPEKEEIATSTETGSDLEI